MVHTYKQQGITALGMLAASCLREYMQRLRVVKSPRSFNTRLLTMCVFAADQPLVNALTVTQNMDAVWCCALPMQHSVCTVSDQLATPHEKQHEDDAT